MFDTLDHNIACVLQAWAFDSTAATTCQPAMRAPSQNPPAPRKSETALIFMKRRSPAEFWQSRGQILFQAFILPSDSAIQIVS
jgi:hypothetical protein